MFYLRLFRLRTKKIAGILLLIFFVSFGLQSSQDLLTQSDSFENITLNQNVFKKAHQTVDQTNISDDDNHAIQQHKKLKSPRILILSFFLNSFKGFQSKRNTDFSNTTYSINIPSIGLFLNNKALLI